MFRCCVLLGGPWVVITGGISPLLWVICIVTLLFTLLVPAHEPPSRVWSSRVSVFRGCRVSGWDFRVQGLELPAISRPAALAHL